MAKIDSLTGIRFVAGYIVVLSHVFGSQSFGITEMGGVSVQLFFVLSGFVMCLNYEDKIKSSQISFSKFILLRLSRLYPVYLLTNALCVVFFLKWAKLSVLVKYFIANSLMVQSWAGNVELAFNQVNAPCWSVSDEMFFYIVFLY